MHSLKFYCINCGEPVKNLYKRYSDTVLKLTECSNCKQIADKYVEYDLVLIVIDVILLRITAYRHILLNSSFKNYWKLYIFVLLMETYTEWVIVLKKNNVKDSNDGNITEVYLRDFDIYLDDLQFYKLFLIISLKALLFITIIYIFTKLYTYYKKISLNLIKILKMVTLSSVGAFLLLPSLIWDVTVPEINIQFVSLYVTLSQLIAYKATCNCPKIWSLVTILSAINSKRLLHIHSDFEDFFNISK